MKKLSAAALLLLAATSLSGTALARSLISPERLSQDVKTLASDAFQGRAPGTEGETVTIDWLVKQLQGIGLAPGGPDGGWTQQVPLVKTQVKSGTMQARLNGATTPLVQGREIYVSTVRPTDEVKIDTVPMVFVGYGVNAPEQGWDDFKGADLKGKVAVFLVNDPDFEATAGDDAAGVFGDRRMTYYGRWTYKFEEAARRGAIAALIVHDTPGAGYGWDTVTAPGGENYDIVRADPNERILLQGWLEGATAERLFASVGQDLATLRAKARKKDFKPVPLAGMTFSADLAIDQTQVMSHNVLAKLPGAERPDEVILYGAHWDAYGIGAPAADGTTVRPGANDDALGVAGLLEIARAFKAGPAPARTVAFGFWTAEERGLSGSEAYALSPMAPAGKTVANITLDILNTGGPARDVVLVGNGQNELEDDLARAAAAQGRTVTPEALPERGLFYRADHLSLARRGVPTLLFMAISGAPDLVKGGRSAGEKWLKDYMACYHQTCDRWTPDLDFRGAADDVSLAYTIGRDLAQSDRWPEWKPGSEFGPIRAQSLGKK
ncbi:MAG TPA: M28 family metallopeptidase [Pedomonas sp.]|uniref:M28 family metallopeptidase n=1 Tax=Pedomonas sp. TaxID=2976421 RepID=UPI002F3EA06C